MLALGLRTLRTRAGSFAGTFVMLAITATIVCAAGQLMATGLGAPGHGRFGAADAVVRADPTVRIGHGEDVDTVDVARARLLPAAAVERAAAVPGVRSATGDIAFPLTVIGRDGAPVPSAGKTPAHGHGWPSAALTPYELRDGRAPAVPGDVVLDGRLAAAGGLRAGDRVRIVTPAGAVRLRVSGIAGASRKQEGRQSSVFFTAGRAQELSGLRAEAAAVGGREPAGSSGATTGAGREPAGSGGVAAAGGAGFTAIAVRAERGRSGDDLRDRLGEAVGGGAEVLDRRHASTADAGDPRATEREALVAILGAGGGMTIAVAVFIVAGTLAFVVSRRRREIALLRAVGATPGQVRRLVLGETALIGLLAGAAGCLAAVGLLGIFTEAMIAVDLAPEDFAVAPHWIPNAIAVATGLVVALLAALVAVRRALAVRPGEALVEAAVPVRRLPIVRWLLGVVALGGGVALVITLSFAALSFATLAALCFAIGIALLAPVALGRPAALIGRPLARLGGAGFLAGGALATGRFRVGAVGAAVALVVALTGAHVLALATGREAARDETAQRVQAGRVIVPRAGDGLPPSLARAARDLPGVRAAAGMVGTEVFLLDRDLTHDGDAWDAAGLDPRETRGALDLDVRAGSLDDVRGHGIAVSKRLTEDGNVGLGDVLSARMADAAPARLRIVAVYDRPNGMGDIVLPRSLALAHASAALDAAVFVAGGSDAALRKLERAVPTAVVRPRAGYLEDVDAQGQETAKAQWVTVALMLLVSAMAVLNTGAMAAADRRRELVLARLAGATRRQVGHALVLEAVVTALVGVAAGAGVALVSLTAAGSDPTGGPITVPWGQAGLVLAGGAALGLVGLLLPAALLARGRLTALAGLRE